MLPSKPAGSSTVVCLSPNVTLRKISKIFSFHFQIEHLTFWLCSTGNKIFIQQLYIISAVLPLSSSCTPPICCCCAFLFSVQCWRWHVKKSGAYHALLWKRDFSLLWRVHAPVPWLFSWLRPYQHNVLCEFVFLYQLIFIHAHSCESTAGYKDGCEPSSQHSVKGPFSVTTACVILRIKGRWTVCFGLQMMFFVKVILGVSIIFEKQAR